MYEIKLVGYLSVSKVKFSCGIDSDKQKLREKAIRDRYTRKLIVEFIMVHLVQVGA